MWPTSDCLCQGWWTTDPILPPIDALENRQQSGLVNRDLSGKMNLVLNHCPLRVNGNKEDTFNKKTFPENYADSDVWMDIIDGISHMKLMECCVHIMKWLAYTESLFLDKITPHLYNLNYQTPNQLCKVKCFSYLSTKKLSLQNVSRISQLP